MAFPRFIPKSLQQFFQVELERLQGLINKAERRRALLDAAERNGDPIEPILQDEAFYNPPGDAFAVNDYLQLLRRKDRIERLAGADPRMREAYDILRKEFTSDSEWIRFFEAALNSVRDYRELHRRKLRAAKLAAQFAKTAKKAARQLVQLQKTGVDLPLALKAHRDEYRFGTEMERDFVVRDIFLDGFIANRPINLGILLTDVYRAADAYSPTFGILNGAVDAALANRERKFDNLRAFQALLHKSPGYDQPLQVTPRVRRALAITVSVAEDVDSTLAEEDVRKALQPSKRDRPKKGSRTRRKT
jgi:hypothetical protein